MPGTSTVTANSNSVPQVDFLTEQQRVAKEAVDNANKNYQGIVGKTNRYNELKSSLPSMPQAKKETKTAQQELQQLNAMNLPSLQNEAQFKNDIYALHNDIFSKADLTPLKQQASAFSSTESIFKPLATVVEQAQTDYGQFIDSYGKDLLGKLQSQQEAINSQFGPEGAQSKRLAEFDNQLASYEAVKMANEQALGSSNREGQTAAQSSATINALRTQQAEEAVKYKQAQIDSYKDLYNTYDNYVTNFINNYKGVMDDSFKKYAENLFQTKVTLASNIADAQLKLYGEGKLGGSTGTAVDQTTQPSTIGVDQALLVFSKQTPEQQAQTIKLYEQYAPSNEEAAKILNAINESKKPKGNVVNNPQQQADKNNLLRQKANIIKMLELEYKKDPSNLGKKTKLSIAQREYNTLLGQ